MKLFVVQSWYTLLDSWSVPYTDLLLHSRPHVHLNQNDLLTIADRTSPVLSRTHYSCDWLTWMHLLSDDSLLPRNRTVLVVVHCTVLYFQCTVPYHTIRVLFTIYTVRHCAPFPPTNWNLCRIAWEISMMMHITGTFLAFLLHHSPSPCAWCLTRRRSSSIVWLSPFSLLPLSLSVHAG